MTARSTASSTARTTARPTTVAGGGGGATPSFAGFDDFSGAAATINGRTATRGGTWTFHPASPYPDETETNGSGGVVSTSSQELPATGGIYYLSEDAPNDQVVCADSYTTGVSYGILYARLQRETYEGYWMQHVPSEKLKIFKRVGSTTTLLGESASTLGNGTKRLELRVEGTTLTGLFDGEELISVTDSSFASGAVGFALTGNCTFLRWWASGVAPPSGTRTYLISGQSNAVGMGTNNQSWSSATYVPWLYGNDDRWRLLTDPYDYAGGEVAAVADDGGFAAGSWIPKFATDLMAAVGGDVAIVPSAKSGTSITEWQPGVDHTDRTTLYGNAAVRANAAKAVTGRLDRVLWYQGEADAGASMSTATYKSYLKTMAAAFVEDTGANVRAVLLQNSTGLTDADEQKIRDAVTAAAGETSDVLVGPDLSDIGTDDSFHPTSDTRLTAIGRRWATSELGTATASGSGGTVTTIEGYKIHTFSSAGTFTLSGASTSVDYLIVGGGGGGGRLWSGGGGGGGVLSGSATLAVGSYPITVGVGGAAADSSGGVSEAIIRNGSNGGDSTFNGLTAYGGGYGAGTGNNVSSVAGGNGGSGGGSAGYDSGGTLAGGLGTSGQGNNGGNTTARGGGGGGGAGAAGQNQPGAFDGGDGGNGVASSITGSSVTYGGGGGASGGVGGTGGGGDGVIGTTQAEDGTDGLGGGGGGGGDTGYTAGRGGSGTVIIRYAL